MNFCPHCGTKNLGGNFCHSCGNNLISEIGQMETELDLGIGVVPNEDFPEAINTLLKHLGQSPKNLEYWKDSVTSGSWKYIPFATMTFKGFKEGKPLPIHELISATLTQFREWTHDSDAPLVWAAIEAKDSIFVYLSNQMFVLKGSEWSVVGSTDINWSANELAGTVGSVINLFIGIDWAEEFSERNDYLLPYLEDSPVAIEWFETISEAALEDEDLIQIPGVEGPGIWISANSWDGPFLGPVSPDPNSQFHRLRLLAIALAQDGFEVSVDYGPFVQSYEDWHSEEGDHSGEVVISADSPSTITSTGVVPVLQLISCEKDETKHVLNLFSQFGLKVS